MGRARKSPSLAQHHRAPDRRAGRLGARRRAGADRRTRRGAASWSGSKPTARCTGQWPKIWFRPMATAPTATTTNISTTAPTYHQVIGRQFDRRRIRRQLSRRDARPTEAQIAAWKILVKVLRARYGIPLDRVYAHNWIDYKDARYCEGCELATTGAAVGRVGRGGCRDWLNTQAARFAVVARLDRAIQYSRGLSYCVVS